MKNIIKMVFKNKLMVIIKEFNIIFKCDSEKIYY